MVSLDQVVEDAKRDFAGAADSAALEDAKARYLGKSGLLTERLEALVSEREVDGGLMWRVRVGPFKAQEEVTQTRGRLQSAGINSTVIRINKTN